MKLSPIVVLVGLYVFFRSSSSSKPRPPAPGQRPEQIACVPRERTGRTFAGQTIDESGWAESRYRSTLQFLTARKPPEVPAVKLPAIARALVAQWAHESDRGDNEYNFNLGGWVARKGRPCFEARDGTSGRRSKWEAFPSLPDSIELHVLRIINQWPRAAVALAENPQSDHWVRLLGQGGYYEAPQDDYARNWRHQLAWVESETAVEA